MAHRRSLLVAVQIVVATLACGDAHATGGCTQVAAARTPAVSIVPASLQESLRAAHVRAAHVRAAVRPARRARTKSKEDNAGAVLVSKLDLGRGQRERQQYDQAIRTFTAIIVGYPGEADPYIERGITYRVMGEYQRAIDDYTTALSLQPGNPIAHGNRGNAYRYLRNFEKALQDYGEALRAGTHPEEYKVYANRGHVYTALGRFDEALPDFNRSIQLNSQYADALMGRASVYREKGQYVRALQDIEAALLLSPDDALLHWNKAEILFASRDYRGSISSYDAAIALAPAAPSLYYNRGNAHKALGLYQEAIRDYEESLRLENDEPWYSLTGMGLAYEALGRMSDAVGKFEEALRAKPGYEFALNGLARVRQARANSTPANGAPASDAARSRRSFEYAGDDDREAARRFAEFLRAEGYGVEPLGEDGRLLHLVYKSASYTVYVVSGGRGLSRIVFVKPYTIVPRYRGSQAVQDYALELNKSYNIGSFYIADDTFNYRALLMYRERLDAAELEQMLQWLATTWDSLMTREESRFTMYLQ